MDIWGDINQPLIQLLGLFMHSCTCGRGQCHPPKGPGAPHFPLSLAGLWRAWPGCPQPLHRTISHHVILCRVMLHRIILCYIVLFTSYHVILITSHRSMLYCVYYILVKQHFNDTGSSTLEN